MSRLPLVAIVLLTLLGLGGWWWLTRDTTIYAPSYSERRFSQLEVGMELEDVYSLLGEPLAIRRGVRPETWCYDGPALAGRGFQDPCLEPPGFAMERCGRGRSPEGLMKKSPGSVAVYVQSDLQSDFACRTEG